MDSAGFSEGWIALIVFTVLMFTIETRMEHLRTCMHGGKILMTKVMMLLFFSAPKHVLPKNVRVCNSHEF